MNRRSALRRGGTTILASMLALSVLAVACGGDDSGSSATPASVDENVRNGIQNALGSSETTAAGGGTEAVKTPTTMAEWEALWAKQRAAVVERIKTNKWGKSADGTKVTGPEGFTIDLTKCPAGWNDTEGVTDSQVQIGITGALSGPQADYGNILRGGDAIFKQYSKDVFFKDSTGKTRT